MDERRERNGHTHPCPRYWNVDGECVCELIDAHDHLADVIDLRDHAPVPG